MKNSEEPIYPTLLRQIGKDEFKIASEKDSREGQFLSSCLGITKREHFASMAMQGLLSNPEQIGAATDFKWAAKHAVGYADALLEELSKQE